MNEGDSKTFTITPNVGYRIVSVLVDGEDKGAISSYTFEDINSNHTISVEFEISFIPGTLTDSRTGTSLSGNISEGTELVVDELTLGNSAAEAVIRAKINDGKETLIWSGNIT